MPCATALYAVGYLAVAVVTGRLATTAATAPNVSRVVLWSILAECDQRLRAAAAH